MTVGGGVILSWTFLAAMRLSASRTLHPGRATIAPVVGKYRWNNCNASDDDCLLTSLAPAPGIGAFKGAVASLWGGLG